MSEYTILLFVFIWAFTNRQSEIAIFPGWKSKLGEWFDTYYNDKLPEWFPGRYAFHSFKGIPVWSLVIMMLIVFDIKTAFYTYLIWAAGQFLGLVTRTKT